MKKKYPSFRISILTMILFTISALYAYGQEYRTIDGRNNNKIFKDFGSTNAKILRQWYSPSKKKQIKTRVSYEDGISKPRGGFGSYSLPGPRYISNALCSQSSLTLNSKKFSTFIWLWGQFLDHDIDLFRDLEDPAEPFPIKIPEDDAFFNICPGENLEMEFFRSEFHPHTGTDPCNPRQQINNITAYIDASQVYGSTKAVQDSLRSFSNGKMKTSEANLLPKAAFGPGENDFFYAAGDIRANEHIGLTAMHTLFVREHNRLAEYIAQNYSDCLPSSLKERDEKIYQMARAIVGAQIQIITYKEFLPRLLGSEAPDTEQHYSTLINPNMSGVFSTAAFRFGHSLLPPTLYRRNEAYQPIEEGDIRLKEAFFSPLELEKTGIEPLLRGAAIQFAQEFDIKVINDVRNFLFENVESISQPDRIAFDLPSLNMQRGRDHGLPAYKDVRVQFVNGKKIVDFDDINADQEIIEHLKIAYRNVGQIDLWAGGLCEAPYKDAFVGETFFHIIKDQFTRLRDGDRFWYKNVDWKETGFKQPIPVIHTSGKELYSITLADIIKWNTQIDHIEPWEAKDPLALYAEKTNESIKGKNDGKIDLYITGEYPPYSIEWDNGSDKASLDNLPPRDYTVWVTDSKGNRANYLVTVKEGCDHNHPAVVAKVATTTNQTQENLVQNYPNPFSGHTHISYKLELSHADNYIVIRNPQGQEVRRLTSLKTGQNELKFSSKNLSPGIYYYQLIQAGKVIDQKTMIVQK